MSQSGSSWADQKSWTLVTMSPGTSCVSIQDPPTTKAKTTPTEPQMLDRQCQPANTQVEATRTKSPVGPVRPAEAPSKQSVSRDNSPWSSAASRQRKTTATIRCDHVPLDQEHQESRKRRLSISEDDDTSCSEGQWDGLESENDPSFDLEYDGNGYSNSGPWNEPTNINSKLPADHEYQLLREDLAQFAYKILRCWAASARYIQPPEHQLRLCTKRARTAMHIEEADPSDPNAVLISAFHGYFHFACPFSIFYPVRHQRCIRQHSLRSIEDVIRHIEQHHIEPPFCHICGRLFDGIKSRNDHLRREICERRNDIELDGASFYQRSKITRYDDPSLCEEDRYRRIWAILFPCKPIDSAYLMKGEGLKFSLLHDHWSNNGREIVGQYLSDHGHSGGPENGAGEFTALCSLVLEDLASMIEAEPKGSDWG